MMAQTQDIAIDDLIIKNSGNFGTALAVNVAAYWVFNLHFDPKLQKTLTFLGHALGLPGVQLSVPVLNVINGLHLL